MSIAEKLTTIAANEKKVYDAGKKAEYDAFWDSYQENGNRSNYSNAFAGKGWTADTFKPKHDIKPTGSSANMFYASSLKGSLVEILTNAGVEMDLSKSTNITALFGSATLITHTGVIDTTSSATINNTFNYMPALVELELVLKDDGSQTFTQAFSYNSNLEKIIIRGKIGQNGFDVHWSTKLTHESLMSIINALYDYKDSGKTYTVTLGTENLAKLTDAEKAIATQKGWTLA